ncbi:MAG: hypothetical protein KGO96_05705 [Elusimicrobia bacterium]|nr:hypothetical protein [Elusimicrobiota bacterium]MDE2425384.1 hypothetical protein [Elusimicrobiota bacterium]
MIAALLHGKLSREQENLEDILTSNVFGLLSYLPPVEGLIPFLYHAQTLDGERPFEGPMDNVRVEYEFWPRYAESGCNPCEPDVELRISRSNRKKILALVECKFLSGKSGIEDHADEDIVVPERRPPTDQLAREWDNLNKRAAQEQSTPVLIYLTADVGMPREDLEDSRLAIERSGERTFNCCWLSWRQLYEVRSEAPIITDLKALLKRLNLIFFHGISDFTPAEPIDWQFPPAINDQLATGHSSTLRSTFDFVFPRLYPIEWRLK